MGNNIIQQQTGANGIREDEQQHKPTVWIVEDELSCRTIFQEVVNSSEHYVCPCAFESCEEAFERLEGEKPPRFFVLDLHFGKNMNGLELLEVIRKKMPETKVLVITGDKTPATMNTAIQRGAAGYLVKIIDLEEIILSLDEIAGGKIPISAEMARHALHLVPEPLDEKEKQSLTPQEKILLPYFTQGKSDKEIADELYRSPDTVHTHRKHVYKKLGVHGIKDFIIKMFTKKPKRKKYPK
ncbi:MAG: response regulator transcription factor [Ignavibacteriae bacterium]|nr:response regulator transcription factor [Ignavibacteriota bacterium]